MVANAEVLERRFGQWPSFHDAEVYAVRLVSGQQDDGVPMLQLDIHVLPSGACHDHMLVTLQFDDVADVELAEFGAQNVLFDLYIRDSALAADAAVPITVELPSSWGLSGSFRCSRASVMGALPFSPGAHSVYRSST